MLYLILYGSLGIVLSLTCMIFPMGERKRDLSKKTAPLKSIAIVWRIMFLCVTYIFWDSDVYSLIYFSGQCCRWMVRTFQLELILPTVLSEIPALGCFNCRNHDMYTHIHAYMHTFINTCIHACLHACMHA